MFSGLHIKIPGVLGEVYAYVFFFGVSTTPLSID
jgi:hypothetical protein